MPPKKKARQSQLSVSTPIEDVHLQTAISPSPKILNALQDPWTDEQEISLFKGVIKWKPAGMHKHFRMIALSGYLRNHGYDPEIVTHTRIDGIWKKLGSLYNLDAIDEREDFDFENGDDDEGSERPYRDFELPLDEFGTEMMERGRDRDGSESPPVQEKGLEESQSRLPGKKRKRESAAMSAAGIRQVTRGSSRIRGSTVDDTDEPRTSPAPRGGRRGRSARTRESSNERGRGTTAESESTKDDGEGTVEDEDHDEEEDDDGDADPQSSKTAKPRIKGARGAPQVASKPRKSARKR